MLKRRNYTRNGHYLSADVRYGVGKFEGGFVFLEGGFAKRGVRTNPPNPPPPPGYGPEAYVLSMILKLFPDIIYFKCIYI